MSLSSRISTLLKVEKYICWAGVQLQIWDFGNGQVPAVLCRAVTFQ